MAGSMLGVQQSPKGQQTVSTLRGGAHEQSFEGYVDVFWVQQFKDQLCLLSYKEESGTDREKRTCPTRVSADVGPGS